jgi:CRISPR/Cas system CSM-associated protein Csm3 (group 7 of RAMP superfamily)
MLKRTLCQAQFTWELSCEGPLLIADGRFNQDVMKGVLTPQQANARKGWYPSKFFINRKNGSDLLGIIKDSGRTAPVFNADFGFYVPGTSIRGPFRAQAERIIRTLAAPNAAVPKTACDPFKQNEPNDQFYCCSKQLETQSAHPPYARVCPACKIFGAAGLASRLQFTDGPIGQGVSVYRDMIGIDRFTGGVYQGGSNGGGANMKLHALEKTKFQTTITLTNFELWHLGLLAYVFQDFSEGLVPIGFGKTKGFGQLTGKITSIALRYCKEPSGIEHLGSLMKNPEETNPYGVAPLGPLPISGFNWSGADTAGLGWYHQRAIQGEANINEFFQAVKMPLNEFVQSLSAEEAA